MKDPFLPPEPLSEFTMPTMSRGYSKQLAVAASIFCAAFISMQFVRPELRSSPAADISAQRPVRQILRKTCYDCHSSETRLKWFDRIAPVCWLVAWHIKQGRHAFNFADFNRLPGVEQRAILFDAIYQIQSGKMPPQSYTLLHPEARVTAEVGNPEAISRHSGATAYVAFEQPTRQPAVLRDASERTPYS